LKIKESKMKTQSKIVKSILAVSAMASCLGAVPALAGDVVRESWSGSRRATGGSCSITHRQLEYSHPELFITFRVNENEGQGDAFAGLDQLQSLDHATFQKLAFGVDPMSLEFNRGTFKYQVVASGSSITQGRVIHAFGYAGDSASPKDATRKHELRMMIQGTKENSKVVVQVTHSRARAFFGGWRTTFQDECVAATVSGGSK